jgi:hypothetical protein
MLGNFEFTDLGVFITGVSVIGEIDISSLFG